jgi:uncharacterized membrane protein
MEKHKVSTFLKFLLNSFLVGIVLAVIIFLIASPAILLYNYFGNELPIKQIIIFLSISLALGVITSLVYIYPLNFAAKWFLKIIATFYYEFYKQSSKYFAKENKTKPFQKVVEVKLTPGITILGLLTNRYNDRLSAVFFPTSPRANSGHIILVDKDLITETTLTPEDFIKYVITYGAHTLIGTK